MEKFTTVSGFMVSNRASVSGKARMESHTLASGKMERIMVMEFTSGRTEIDMRESLTIVSSMAKEQILSRMGIRTLVSTSMVSRTALVPTSGRTGQATLETLLMESRMVQVSGRKTIIRTATSTKAISSTT